MNSIRNYIVSQANATYEQQKARANGANDAPCVKCGGEDFIQLYRNVVGEVEGSMHGSFSIFGGSVSGYISGYTKTLPVLSCSNCNNERTISTYSYPDMSDMFWSDMHHLYFGVSHGEPERIEKFHAENPIYRDNLYALHEYLQNEYNWTYDFFHDMKHWDVATFAHAGFNVEKKQRKFLFIKWKSYPTWKELENEQ